MWQVLLAAAAAGSGLLAKRLFTLNYKDFSTVSEQTFRESDQIEDNQLPSESNSSSLPQGTIFLGVECHSNSNGNGETEISSFGSDGSVFRFSSTSGPREPNVSRLGSKNLRKKLALRPRSFRANAEGFRNVDDKKCGFVNAGGEMVIDQRKKGKKFSACLKKRRTSKTTAAKCEACSSKGNSLFGWGLGVGIMYMMSTGKVEFDRLNMTMDETMKVVQELKSELSRRKSSSNKRIENPSTKFNNDSNNIGWDHNQPILTQPSIKVGYGSGGASLLANDGVECASSVLTEYQQPEALEMDCLEKELETELQKLPWCVTETSDLGGREPDNFETKVSVEVFNEPEVKNANSYQLNGVSPSELDQKLCHLIIEQQESQIVELESELHRSHSKLRAKEAELQALKECVRRLTKFSLASASDEESEARGEEKKAGDWNQGDALVVPEEKKSAVGMKRALDVASYGCYTE